MPSITADDGGGDRPARVELMEGDHLTALNDPRLSRLIAEFLAQDS